MQKYEKMCYVRTFFKCKKMLGMCRTNLLWCNLWKNLFVGYLALTVACISIQPPGNYQICLNDKWEIHIFFLTVFLLKLIFSYSEYYIIGLHLWNIKTTPFSGQKEHLRWTVIEETGVKMKNKAHMALPEQWNHCSGRAIWMHENDSVKMCLLVWWHLDRDKFQSAMFGAILMQGIAQLAPLLQWNMVVAASCCGDAFHPQNLGFLSKLKGNGWSKIQGNITKEPASDC